MAGHTLTSNAIDTSCFPQLDDAIVVLVPWVYILRCSDNTLYIGHTNDVAAREKTHNEGHGSRYTAVRRPVTVVYAEQLDSAEDAIAREHQLKRWTRAKKEVTGWRLPDTQTALANVQLATMREQNTIPYPAIWTPPQL